MIVLTLKDEANVRLLIAQSGNSLRDFSKQIGLSHAYLSQILSRKRNPSPKVALKIARGLNLETQDIFLFKVSAGNGQHEES